MDNEKVFAMPVARVYPLLVAKAERKGRTKQEVDTVTCWLTGYTPEHIQQHLDAGSTYQQFFDQAPCLHPNSSLIKGTICGIRIEEIADPLMQNIRRLDKLVDELAKGKPLEKILR